MPMQNEQARESRGPSTRDVRIASLAAFVLGNVLFWINLGAASLVLIVAFPLGIAAGILAWQESTTRNVEPGDRETADRRWGRLFLEALLFGALAGVTVVHGGFVAILQLGHL